MVASADGDGGKGKGSARRAAAGKVAVVTGASRGIGRAIAAALVRAGAQVAGCALSVSGGGAGRGFLDDVGEQGGASFLVPCDVRRSEEVARFQQQVERDLGSPDVLVNNAGIVVRAELLALPEADWNDVMAANLTRRLPGHQGVLAGDAGARGGAAGSSTWRRSPGGRGRPCSLLLRRQARGSGPDPRRWPRKCGRRASGQRDLPGLGRHRHVKDRHAGRGAADDRPRTCARTALFLAADAPAALTGACIDVFG